MLTAGESESYRDTHRGQDWFRKTRDELATPYLEGLCINIWMSHRALGRLHQNVPARQSLVPTWEYTIYVPFITWSHTEMGLTSCRGYSAAPELGCSKLHAVSLLWINLNTEAWIFTLDIIHIPYPLMSPPPPKARGRTLTDWGVLGDIMGSLLPVQSQNTFGNTGPRLLIRSELFVTRIHLNATLIPGSILKLPLSYIN